MDKLYVFYHKADMDGLLSAMIVKRWLETSERPSSYISLRTNMADAHFFFSNQVVYVPANYGDNFDDVINSMDEHDNCIMLDFVLYNNGQNDNLDITAIAAKISNPVIVIDHHVSQMAWLETACKDLLAREKIIIAPYDKKRGACKAVWEFFFQADEFHKQPLPLFIDIASAADTWDRDYLYTYQLRHEVPNKLEQITWAKVQEWSFYWRYCQNMDFTDTTFSNEKLNELFGYIDTHNNDTSRLSLLECAVMKIIEEGEVAHQVLAGRNRTIWQAGFHTNIMVNGKTLRAYLVADYNNNGNVFEDVVGPVESIVPEVDFVLLCKYDFRANKFRCTVFGNPKGDPNFSSDIIAKSFGGGGHKGCAGFSCDDVHSMTLSDNETMITQITVSSGTGK